MKIESGTGNGRYAGVDKTNHLAVSAIILPRQHFVSKVDQKSFQVIGTATPANGTVNVLNLSNNTSDKTFTFTYIRSQLVDPAGGTALPNASNYLQIGSGLTYASGGTIVTPRNVHVGSAVTSGGSAYAGNPTLTGDFVEYDRYYFKSDGDDVSYSKEGSLILPPGRSLTARYVGDHTSGTVYVRFSFYATDVDSLDVTR